jgi:hypothetical protein
MNGGYGLSENLERLPAPFLAESLERLPAPFLAESLERLPAPFLAPFLAQLKIAAGLRVVGLSPLARPLAGRTLQIMR